MTLVCFRLAGPKLVKTLPQALFRAPFSPVQPI